MDRFETTKTWVFDLDNTLYPPECDLFAQIDERMGAFISEFLGMDRTEARKVQKRYFVEHGTTLNGLMTVHDLEPEVFLDFVHDIDHSPVEGNDRLDGALSELPGRKIIFTNGTVSHADRVLTRLGVGHHFSSIYDIVSTGYRPKPYRDAYKSMLESEDLLPDEATMFEDISRNLEVPHELGMNTVLVKSSGSHPDEEFGLIGSGEEEHIHHVTSDLPGFLQDVTVHISNN